MVLLTWAVVNAGLTPETPRSETRDARRGDAATLRNQTRVTKPTIKRHYRDERRIYASHVHASRRPSLLRSCRMDVRGGCCAVNSVGAGVIVARGLVRKDWCALASLRPSLPSCNSAASAEVGQHILHRAGG